MKHVVVNTSDAIKTVCQCCGHTFTPSKEMRYTARDNTPGKQLFGVAPETKQYDAFDCPQCGCQIIAGERLRPVDEAVFALGDIDEVHEDDIPETTETPGAIEVDE